MTKTELELFKRMNDEEKANYLKNLIIDKVKQEKERSKKNGL